MPRKKRKIVLPLETFFFEVDGVENVAEVWDDSSCEGTRGSHMRRKFNRVFNLVLNKTEEGLNGQSNIAQLSFTRMIYGSESLTVFGKYVTTVAKINKITIGKTLSEKIAKKIRTHYLALEAALAEMERRGNLVSP